MANIDERALEMRIKAVLPAMNEYHGIIQYANLRKNAYILFGLQDVLKYHRVIGLARAVSHIHNKCAITPLCFVPFGCARKSGHKAQLP
jgi:hypothetical protein